MPSAAAGRRLVADLDGLAAQHRVLVQEHQELSVPGHLAPGQHHQAAIQAAHGQVNDREDHKYALEEELLDHSPAAHVRRPRVDYESHAVALDRNELGALLVARGLGPSPEHALISLLTLNGLRVSEATVPIRARSCAPPPLCGALRLGS